MNEKPDLPSEEELRFDRLVDGELSPEEYRQLVASLDDEPAGWRSCALAFLEAQALGQDLSAVRHTTLEPKPAIEKARAVERTWPGWSLWLAVAASFLVALGLGISFKGWPLFTNESLVKHGVQRPATEWSPPGGLAQQPRSDSDLLGNLTLVADGGSGAQSEPINLPVYDARNAAERLSFEESALPADVRQALERTGHRIEARQEWVPVLLQDGRQVVFPVEQFRIVPAARRPY